MALDMAKLRVDMRNDTRRVYRQMLGAIAATVASTGAIITATIADQGIPVRLP